jgi:hypothetical protein
MKLVPIALPLALVPLFLADEIAFRPASGSSVSKELAIDVELGLDEVSMSMNGQELPPEMLGQAADQKLLVNLVMEVTEKYVSAKEGRPIELLRTFDDLSANLEFGGESETTEGADELKGKTVRFAWNDDEKRYDKSWHESTGDDEDLESLSEDMDLRVLLPTKSVSEGDTWEAAGVDLAPLFMPGGFANGGEEDDEESAAIEEEVVAQLESFVKEFKVTCKYAGMREDGDVKAAEITFVFEGAPKLDMGAIIERVAAAQGDAPEADVSAIVGASFKGEGTLLWNTAAGHVHAFEMQSALELDVDISADVNEEGQAFKVEIGAAASGQVTWKMSAKKL